MGRTEKGGNGLAQGRTCTAVLRVDNSIAALRTPFGNGHRNHLYVNAPEAGWRRPRDSFSLSSMSGVAVTGSKPYPDRRRKLRRGNELPVQKAPAADMVHTRAGATRAMRTLGHLPWVSPIVDTPPGSTRRRTALRYAR